MPEEIFINHFFEILTPEEWSVRLATVVILLLLFLTGIIDLISLTKLTILFYLILFSAVGANVRSIFTNLSNWNWHTQELTYQFKGTGTYINPNHVLTNHHVIDECNHIAVKAINETPHLARVIASDSTHDLAILETNANVTFYTVLRNRSHEENGEKAFYPEYTSLSGEFIRKVGYIKTRNNSSKSIELLNIGGRAGNSGSPIYDARGYLIGVIHSGLATGLGPIDSAYGEGLESVADFLRKHKIPVVSINNDINLFKKHANYINRLGVGVLCTDKKD